MTPIDNGSLVESKGSIEEREVPCEPDGRAEEMIMFANGLRVDGDNGGSETSGTGSSTGNGSEVLIVGTGCRLFTSLLERSRVADDGTLR